MPSITFHASHNFDDSCLKGLSARIEEAMIDATGEGTEIIRDKYEDYINKDTGRTASTIQSEHAGLTGYIGSDDEVARYLEYGTSAHTIEAAPGSALYWPGAAHPVKHVNHPGTPEYAPLLRAGEASVGEVEAAYVAKLEEVFASC